jgi:hypothetical protein
MDLIKNFPRMKHVLKQIVFMVKTLQLSHLLLQLFDKLCLEKFKKTYMPSSSRRPDGAPYFSPRSMPTRLRRRAQRCQAKFWTPNSTLIYVTSSIFVGYWSNLLEGRHYDGDALHDD